MTILEDLKSGRLVVVPREALADLCDAVMADVSEAKRRLDAGIPKDAPVHPVSAFLTGTALHIGKARASPDHTAGLIALVEGMERERDVARAGRAEAERENKRLDRELTAAQAGQIANIARREEANAYGDAEHARALAAEAEVVRLKARIADLEERHYAD
jgi:hypothetical protein